MGLMDAYCNQTITWFPQIVADQYGQTSGSVGVALSARLENKTELVTNMQGQQVVSSGRLFVQPGTAIKPNDQIALGDGRKFHILRVDQAQGLNRSTYVCAHLGG